jgi:hypothetical protein
VPKNLIFPSGISVVIGMPLKLKKKEVRQEKAGIPGVQGVDAFVFAVGEEPALHPIMLNIVHHFQERKAQKALREEEYWYLPGKGPFEEAHDSGEGSKQ